VYSTSTIHFCQCSKLLGLKQEEKGYVSDIHLLKVERIVNVGRCRSDNMIDGCVLIIEMLKSLPCRLLSCLLVYRYGYLIFGIELLAG
jgi:hypothetical protein